MQGFHSFIDFVGYPVAAPPVQDAPQAGDCIYLHLGADSEFGDLYDQIAADDEFCG